MRISRIVVGLVVGVVAIACSSDPEGHGPPCEAKASGEGVEVTVRSASCDYDYGSSATFEYEITITDALAPIEVAAGTGCGSCRKHSDEIAPWTSWGINGTSTSGDAQVFCLCDTGCCAPDKAGTFAVKPGTLKDKISWSGRTWSGPSDTGQQQGDFFKEGRYEVAVAFGSTAAKLPFVIREP